MDENISNNRKCKRCLLKEYDEQEYREKLEILLKRMDKKTKADEALYENRLSICRECDKLSMGTCLGCGCYVELRAAVKHDRCPYRYW